MSNFINVAYAHSEEVDGTYGIHNFGMMNGAGSVLWVIMCLLILVIVILGIVALFKYVFNKGKKHNK